MKKDFIEAFGWIPDPEDTRDFTLKSKQVKDSGLPKLLKTLPGLAASVDLRQWCSPIENQGTLATCAANAAVGILEYCEKRANGRYLDGSRLFVFKQARRLMNMPAVNGAFLRSAMGAMALFGVPPELYWPYTTAALNSEPDAFNYAYAQSFKAGVYFRLDPVGTPKQTVIDQAKANLAAGFPCMFGFNCYKSALAQASSTGAIPYPASGDTVSGAHAVMAVGYDDNKVIKNTSGGSTTGAFLIRNSWGTGWGMAGYGWLPYQYVLGGIAIDWWCMTKASWVDSGQFGV
jgi:C1A family cysteine protease